MARIDDYADRAVVGALPREDDLRRISPLLIPEVRAPLVERASDPIDDLRARCGISDGHRLYQHAGTGVRLSRRVGLCTIQRIGVLARPPAAARQIPETTRGLF
jgi:hypothetical protein